MIEVGDMVYWNGMKCRVRDIYSALKIVSVVSGKSYAMAFTYEVKPIYRNGVKVRV